VLDAGPHAYARTRSDNREAGRRASLQQHGQRKRKQSA
jgi:hypothetical protein